MFYFYTASKTKSEIYEFWKSNSIEKNNKIKNFIITFTGFENRNRFFFKKLT